MSSPLPDEPAVGTGPTLRVVTEPTEADDRTAAADGLTVHRDVHQLRRPLPVPEHERGRVAEAATRPFRPGADDDAWLAVNNRAFADHPEQSGWTTADLAERLAAPWFDADGFVLHERDGVLAGFCWTKIHAGADPPLGEIYVIGVDPAFHGRGLGRALTLAGLDWLAARGMAVGMLYADADNTTAMRLYTDLGFTIHHTDRVYRAPA